MLKEAVKTKEQVSFTLNGKPVVPTPPPVPIPDKSPDPSTFPKEE